MKFFFNIFVFIVLSLGCSTEKEYLVGGEYKSIKPSFFKTFFSNNCNSYVLGNTLFLNKDSTYNMSTCAMIIEGHWFVQKDTLFLKEEVKKFRIDSLNNNQEWKKYLNISDKPDFYIISRNYLIKTFKNDDGLIIIDEQKRTPNN